MGAQTTDSTNTAVPPVKTASPASSQPDDPLLREDPKEVWDKLQLSFLQLDAPGEWRTNRPPRDVLTKWRINKARMAVQMADQSRDYYQRYPDVPEAVLARESEYNLLEIAVNSGNTNLLDRLTVLDQRKLADPSLSRSNRFDLMVHIVQRNADCHEAEGVPAVMAHLETGSRDLLKAFPDNPESWQFLVTVADQEQDPEKARRLVNEILAGNASESLKLSTRRIQGRLDHLNKPIPFHGVGLDGRPIDLTRMKGKVVMFHFWDTDCGYCLDELNEIKSVYEKFHPRGFEIISISFNPDRDSLVQFLARHPLAWPQYLAGPDWDATHGRDFDVQAMPSLWLVDGRGNLRDLNARENLASSIEKLLNEK